MSSFGGVNTLTNGAHLLPKKMRQKWVAKRWVGFENIRKGLNEQAEIPAPT